LRLWTAPVSLRREMADYDRARVDLVRLDEIVGWELRPGSGRPVDAGWAHGSRAIDPVLEKADARSPHR
jgi:hypothetical protein